MPSVGVESLASFSTTPAPQDHIITQEREIMARSKEDVLRQVQALLDRAAATGFTAEADACRKKADDLMLAWSIEHWEIQQRKKPNEREKPEVGVFDICGKDNPLEDHLTTLFSALCRYVGARPVYYGLNNKYADTHARAVGFPSDLDYLRMLYTSLQVQMQSDLTPKPDPSFDFEDNLAMLKEAGMKWEDIHRMLRPDVPWERKHGVRYTKMYTDHCEKHGKSRMYTSPKVYQLNFAHGFVLKVADRLRDIEMARKQDQPDGGSGMELMLRDKNKEVGEMYDEMFKNLRFAKPKNHKFDNSAFSRGSAAGSRADLGQSKVGGGPKELG